MLFSVAVALVLAGDPAPVPSKSPWELTTGERIARRVDPAGRKLRRVRELERAKHVVAEGRSPVVGKLEPELFFEWELLETMARMTNAQTRNGLWSRDAYKPSIEKFGWNASEFWLAFDTSLSTYQSLIGESAELARISKGKMPPPQSLEMKICRARAASLSELSARLGEERFRKFLYTEVAPMVFLWTDDSKETASLLAAWSKGCE
jgi:hypothetical protein